MRDADWRRRKGRHQREHGAPYRTRIDPFQEVWRCDVVSILDRFTAAMREHVTNGEIGFRKANIGSIVDRVEVDVGEVRIIGRKDVLEQCVMVDTKPGGAVRRFVRGWLGR